MSGETRRNVSWKTGLAVGAGVVAVAGVAAITYKLIQARKARKASAAQVATEDDTGEPERTTPLAGSTPVKNGGSVPVGKQNIPKSDYEQALELKQEGNGHYRNLKFDDAVRCYQEALMMCPKDKKDDLSKLYQNIAAVYTVLASQAPDKSEQSGHWMSVVDYCTRALELNKRYTKALSRRLKAYEALGQKRDALLDVTRVVILDETQAAGMAETITTLLRDLGKEEAAVQFANLDPLAPTNHIVKTYLESFVWNDDLSEERLRKLWEEHSRKTGAAQGAESQTQGSEKSEEEGAMKDDARPEITVTDASNVETEVTENSEAPVEETDSTEAPVVAAGDCSLDVQMRGFSEDPFVLAAAKFRKKQYHGIIEMLTKAIEKGCPAFLPHALLLRGTFYTMWRDNEKGLKDLDAVINMEGVSEELILNAIIKTSTIYAGIPDMGKVKECFDRCLQLDESCPDALIHKSRIKLESPDDAGSMDGVVECLKKAISLAPQSAYALYSLATAYHRLASFLQSPQVLNEAVSTFDKAVKKFPDYGDGLILYAMCLQDITQASKAEEFLVKAAKLEPENPSVHLSLGMVALLAADHPKAKAHLQKAIAVDNSCVQAYDSLASLELQEGNSQGALDLYTTATRFARSQTELSQVLVAKEVISAQQEVCREYGLSVKDLMSRALQSSMM